MTQHARVLGFCTDRLTGREIAVEPVRFWLNVTIIILGGCLSLLILKVGTHGTQHLNHCISAVMVTGLRLGAC